MGGLGVWRRNLKKVSNVIFHTQKGECYLGIDIEY